MAWGEEIPECLVHAFLSKSFHGRTACDITHRYSGPLTRPLRAISVGRSASGSVWVGKLELDAKRGSFVRDLLAEDKPALAKGG